MLATPQRSRKLLRQVLSGLFFIAVCSTGSAELYIRFHYAAVMPRAPQPETGRIYPIPAQYGGIIYVNECDLKRRDFVDNTMGSATGVIVVLLIVAGISFGWFKEDEEARKRARFYNE